jgi:hypothetical protein
MRQTLDRGDLAAVVLDGQGEAGVDPHAVGEHSARTAGALVTALLGTGQAEPLAERVEQTDPRLDIEGLDGAVHLHPYLGHAIPPSSHANRTPFF